MTTPAPKHSHLHIFLASCILWPNSRNDESLDNLQDTSPCSHSCILFKYFSCRMFSGKRQVSEFLYNWFTVNTWGGSPARLPLAPYAFRHSKSPGLIWQQNDEADKVMSISDPRYFICPLCRWATHTSIEVCKAKGTFRISRSLSIRDVTNLAASHSSKSTSSLAYKMQRENAPSASSCPTRHTMGASPGWGRS